MTDQTPDRYPETPIERTPHFEMPPDPPHNHPMTDSQMLNMIEGKQP